MQRKTQPIKVIHSPSFRKQHFNGGKLMLQAATEVTVCAQNHQGSLLFFDCVSKRYLAKVSECSVQEGN